MASPVQICNLALSLLGDSGTVASIDPPDGTAPAEMCANMYPIAVNAVLQMHRWTFATRRRTAAPLTNVDPDGWRGVFAVPSDALRVFEVHPRRRRMPIFYDSSSGYIEQYVGNVNLGRSPWLARYSPRLIIDTAIRDHYAFEIGSTPDRRVLYTDVREPVIEYVSSETQPSVFSPDFVTALAWYLAYLLAGQRIKAREGAQIALNARKMFDQAFLVAVDRDSTQRSFHRPNVPTWIAVR